MCRGQSRVRARPGCSCPHGPRILAVPESVNPPVPPISARDEPSFGSAERKVALAAAFQDQGEDYDRLRPGYPPAVLDAILAEVTCAEPRAVDLGAGTGKFSWALAQRGLAVTAVDTSRAMLETALRRGPAADPGAAAPSPATTLATKVAPAETTGLPGSSAELVTVAQAWHWFDAEAASAEVTRLLIPGGVLALVWNMLDVTIPWVHRLSRIMHAGDIHREEFTPTVGPGLVLASRSVHRWEDPMPTRDVIDLARTRSYVITATEERRAKVLANLDWYLHEHLGHSPGDTLGVPYRTDLFLYRAPDGTL
jgi:SAM-dependent methyltransferase